MVISSYSFTRLAKNIFNFSTEAFKATNEVIIVNNLLKLVKRNYVLVNKHFNSR